MNLNNLITRVASLIGDKMDGDTVLLIEQHLPDALKSTCRFIAEHKPLGHEKIMLEQIVGNASITQEDNIPYKQFELSVLEFPIIVQRRFHKAKLRESGDTDNHVMYPVQSLEALALAATHERTYYFIDELVTYIAYPSKVNDIDRLLITHYVFMTISQFPDEMADFLVAELVRIIQNEGQKQMMEAAKP